MLVLSHPLRLDAQGALATVDDTSPTGAAELAVHVLATVQGERPLAPTWGVPDLPGRDDVDLDVIAAAVEASEPDLTVTQITASTPASGLATARVHVTWAPRDTVLTPATASALDIGEP